MHQYKFQHWSGEYAYHILLIKQVYINSTPWLQQINYIILKTDECTKAVMLLCVLAIFRLFI